MEIFDALQLNDFSGHIGEHFKFVVRTSFSHHSKAGKNIFGCSWIPGIGVGHFSCWHPLSYEQFSVSYASV